MVSYFFWINGKDSGFGNTYITPADGEDIYTEAFIVDMEKQIKIELSFDGVVIQNIIPLNA